MCGGVKVLTISLPFLSADHGRINPFKVAIVNNSPPRITHLLHAWNRGDRCALDQVLDLLYDDLKRMSRGLLRQEHQYPGLQTTELVNQMFLSLVKKDEITWQDRHHFFQVAAIAMRRVLITEARKRMSRRRGAGAPHTTLDEETDHLCRETSPEEWLQVDEALVQLEKVDARVARVVVLRFFGGYTIDETAESLELSTATVTRDLEICQGLAL